VSRLEREGDTEKKPFWHLDDELGELKLQERPGGPDRYTVRLKARTATTPYHAKRELYPLKYEGTEHEVSGKAYILVPDITLTVGLFPQKHPSRAIDEVTDASWQGMRHHEIASVRGLYYQEDQTLAIWEIDAFGRLDATWIFTDDAEPGQDRAENRVFLQSLGYQPVAGTSGIVRKKVVRS